MKNEYFNRPLYPESDYEHINKAFSQSLGENSKDQPHQKSQGGISNLFSNLGQGGQNSLLSLLLGMKGGGNNINNILSNLGGGNPLFEALSSFQSSQKSNKKESEGSPKNIPTDEILF